MRKTYKSFLEEITKQRIKIETDIGIIDKGIKEKACFKPIIDIGSLVNLRAFLIDYMGELTKIVERIEEKESEGEKEK